MTSTDVRQRPDTHEMIVVHRIFRREASLLPQLVRAVPDGSTERAALIAQHFRDYQLGLHHHHTGEDELVWPLLLARVDLEAELVLRMEAQHDVITRSLADVNSALPAWEAAPSAATAEPVTAALSAHLSALHEHLADEEDNILPLIAEHLTVAEWARLGQRFASETPKDKLLVFLGAILEEAGPAERAKIMGNLPVSARLAWRVIGRRQYARKTTRLRAGISSPPRGR